MSARRGAGKQPRRREAVVRRSRLEGREIIKDQVSPFAGLRSSRISGSVVGRAARDRPRHSVAAIRRSTVAAGIVYRAACRAGGGSRVQSAAIFLIAAM